MNPKKIFLMIPLASLMILTPGVSASPIPDECETIQADDHTLAALDSASTVEEERAIFQAMVEEQDSDESVAEDYQDEATEEVHKPPSSWWSEFNQFLNTTDLPDLPMMPD